MQMSQPGDSPAVTMAMQNAIHIPGLTGNYFSVNAATDTGLVVVVFDATNVMLFTSENRKLIAIGGRKGNMY